MYHCTNSTRFDMKNSQLNSPLQTSSKKLLNLQTVLKTSTNNHPIYTKWYNIEVILISQVLCFRVVLITEYLEILTCFLNRHHFEFSHEDAPLCKFIINNLNFPPLFNFLEKKFWFCQDLNSRLPLIRLVFYLKTNEASL